jgi:urea carboxylase
MDSWSFRLANILVGNKPGDAALECQFMGPTLKFSDDRTIAITGADMSPKIDGKSVPMWESIEVKANQILELEFATIGARSYIAFAGGINSKPWLGSRSTFHKAGVGGIDGKAIENNQIIPLGKNRKIQQRKIKKSSIPEISKDKNWSIEVVLGPNDDWIDNKGHEIFFNSKWKLQAKSDRTGYRLDGPNYLLLIKLQIKVLKTDQNHQTLLTKGTLQGLLILLGKHQLYL